MGNCISGNKVSAPEGTDSIIPENKDNTSKVDEETVRQRRRLSVAPEHVGDITKLEENSEDKTDENDSQQSHRFSLLSSKHLSISSDKDTNNNLHIAITKKGFVPYNTKKVNQDSYFIHSNFGNNNHCHLIGVCDGHGEVGEQVSQLIAKKLPQFLLKQDYLKKPKESMRKAVEKTSNILRSSKVNTAFSGSTLVFSLIIDDIIYTANLGDSRAVIGSKNDNSNDSLINIDLSIDQKPDDQIEKKRILKSGGRVARLPGGIDEEDGGPFRVWLADVDIPGLAMSRSLGDDVAHSVGVSDKPIIKEYKINKTNDLFMVLASDGIWEFIDSNECVNLMYKTFNDSLKNTALDLVNESINRWKKEEDVIDDITAVIFNLKMLKYEKQ